MAEEEQVRMTQFVSGPCVAGEVLFFLYFSAQVGFDDLEKSAELCRSLRW